MITHFKMILPLQLQYKQIIILISVFVTVNILHVLACSLVFLIVKSYLLIVGGACWIVCVIVGEGLTLFINMISSLKKVLLKLLKFAHFNQKSCCDETKEIKWIMSGWLSRLKNLYRKMTIYDTLYITIMNPHINQLRLHCVIQWRTVHSSISSINLTGLLDPFTLTCACV